MSIDVEALQEQLRQSEAACAALREALEFYADPSTYDGPMPMDELGLGRVEASDWSMTPLGSRPGIRARAALAPAAGAALLESLRLSEVVVAAAQDWGNAKRLAHKNPGKMLSSGMTGDEAEAVMTTLFASEDALFEALAAHAERTAREAAK